MTEIYYRPKYVGRYCLGGQLGFCILLPKRPNIIQRFFMKHLLGWDWYDLP